MPRIYLCFLWHMHQPFYKDLVSGEYRLPWTRMHALKDYYGMARLLEEFPTIRQTFNLVPSMMVQIEEYASGAARDPFLEAALKPAETLRLEDRQFILKHFFHANPGRMIYRYPRYGELFTAWNQHKKQAGAAQFFGAQEIRDLQVLSQLAWFDEYFQDEDELTIALIQKGRNYSLEDQRLVGELERQIISRIIPEYRKLAKSGQIEISTTPFYHPILPLLCDSDIARVAHPGVPLPARFQYPGDAREQLVRARDYMEDLFGAAPKGLWPSEGSVSDEVFRIAAEAGFQWSATDNGVLDRTIGRGAGVDQTYKPWQWSKDGRTLGVLFRDHLLSDLIGFVYSGMAAQDAARDFLARIRSNCKGILNSNCDAVVPIILDGENAWEYYDRGGRPFFRALYGGIEDDPEMEAIAVGEAFERVAPSRLDHIFPGSWINSNFDVWIGAEEDNQAWNLLLAARQTYDCVSASVPEAARKLAWEELLISEGSDWCWWYGPEHDTANREEFDALFRGHIANVYRSLGVLAPAELSRPISRVDVAEWQISPSGPIQVEIDGRVTSYFEWLGAGVYRLSARGGAMHGKRFVVSELFYGSDGRDLLLRFDFAKGSQEVLNGLELRLVTRRRDNGASHATVNVQIHNGAASLASPSRGVECAFQEVLEVAIPLPELPSDLEFQASFWHDSLPIDSIPLHGWLSLPLQDEFDWFV